MPKYKGPFAKADKSVCDAFKRPYYFGHSASIATQTANGLSFEAEADYNAKGNDVSFTAEYADPSGFNVDKLSISNDGTFEGALSLNGVVDNTKFTLETVLKNLDSKITPGQESSTLGVEYTHDMAVAQLIADPFNRNTKLELIVKQSGFSVGGTVSGAWGSEDKDAKFITNYDAFLGYSGDGYNVGLKTTNQLGGACLTLKNKLNDSTDVFMKVDYTKPAAVKEGEKAPAALDSVDIGVAVAYKVDQDSTLNAKFNKDRKLTTSYCQLLRPNVKFTVSAEVNLDITTEETADDTKFGMKFNFGDL